MLIEPLQVAPGAPAILGRGCPFPPNAHRIDAARCQGEDGFETDITFPVGTKVIHIPEALAAMEAQVMQPDSVGRNATAAVLPAMNIETVQVLVTPGKQDLEDRVQVCQGGRAVHQHTAPDERADATQDDPQLIDTERR